MPSVKEILRQHDELVSLRKLEEPEWREIAAIMAPEEADIGRSRRRHAHDDIYDSTPQVVLDRFAGGLFNQTCSPADRWMELGLDDEDLGAWGPVKNYNYAYTNLIFSSASPAVSSFYGHMPAVFRAQGLFGLGALYSDEVAGAGRFRDIAIPMAELFIDTAGEGNLIRADREFSLRKRQIAALFGEDAAAAFKGDSSDNRSWKIIHAVFPNPDFRAGALGPRGMAWSSVYCCADVAAFRVDKGYYEMPYHMFPWSLRSGYAYPVGPGHRVRADALMLNEMEKDHIIAANFAARPTLLAHDDSVLTAADIRPSRILRGSINEDGKPLVQPLSLGADIRLSMAQSEQRRNALREHLFFDLMQLANRPQMTATEFLGFKEQMLKLMGGNLALIHNHGLATWVARRAKMLARAGLVPPPPPEMANRRIEIRFTSPLAKAQKAASGHAMQLWLGGVQQMAAIKPEVADKINEDKYAELLQDALGAPPAIVKDQAAVDQMRAARAQEQAQQAALAKAGAGAAAFADAAHAAQAVTLAQGRTSPGKAA